MLHLIRQAPVIVALLLTGLASPAISQSPPMEVLAEVAVETTFHDRIHALGRLRANESITITANAADTIQKLLFDDGQRVKAGQLLVTLTADEEEAQLKEAKYNVAEAEKQLNRVARLLKQGLAAESQFDESQRTVDTARAQVIAIESRLRDRMIRAPFDGILGLRQVSPGARIEPGDVITTLVDDNQLKLDFPVPSVFIGALQPGLSITTKSAAFPDETFTGNIVSIDNRIDPVSASILVRGAIPNPDYRLKPGLLMNVELLHHARRGLAIPEQALVPEGNSQFVFVVAGQEGRSVALKRAVTIGGRVPGMVEVIRGLTAGERVVTHGNFKLRPGQEVTWRDASSSSVDKAVTDILLTSDSQSL